MKWSNSYFAIAIIFIFLVLQGCSGGSSSSDGAGLSCTDIAGKYNGSLIFPGLNPPPGMDVTVNQDCSFVAKNSLFGVNTGTLTSQEGNVYIGSGNSPDGCNGPFDVKVVDKGNGRVNVIPTCQANESGVALHGIEVL
jgi:hypothetical protein